MQWNLRDHIVSNLFTCVRVCVCVCYSNLPAKPAEEAQKHRQQYEEMVAQAKKRGEAYLTEHIFPACFIKAQHTTELTFSAWFLLHLINFPVFVANVSVHAPVCRAEGRSEEEEAARGSMQAWREHRHSCSDMEPGNFT